MTTEAFRTLGPVVSKLARAEGLVAHARAAEIRMELVSQEKVLIV